MSVENASRARSVVTALRADAGFLTMSGIRTTSGGSHVAWPQWPSSPSESPWSEVITMTLSS